FSQTRHLGSNLMQRNFRNLMIWASLVLTTSVPSLSATETNTASVPRITKAHGFALHGDLKYPPDFTHFDYVNPNAEKGGRVRLMGHGTFDSLSPYPLKGTSPTGTPGFYLYGINELNETLLVGTEAANHTGDEPQSAYGLLAAS